MKETQFKVLMYASQYVDTNLLEKGIYTASTPTLYSKDTTIENMTLLAELMRDASGNKFITEKYFNNLKKCELVSVSLIGEF